MYIKIARVYLSVLLFFHTREKEWGRKNTSSNITCYVVHIYIFESRRAKVTPRCDIRLRDGLEFDLSSPRVSLMESVEVAKVRFIKYTREIYERDGCAWHSARWREKFYFRRHRHRRNERMLDGRAVRKWRLVLGYWSGDRVLPTGKERRVCILELSSSRFRDSFSLIVAHCPRCSARGNIVFPRGRE